MTLANTDLTVLLRTTWSTAIRIKDTAQTEQIYGSQEMEVDREIGRDSTPMQREFWTWLMVWGIDESVLQSDMFGAW